MNPSPVYEGRAEIGVSYSDSNQNLLDIPLVDVPGGVDGIQLDVLDARIERPQIGVMPHAHPYIIIHQDFINLMEDFDTALRINLDCLLRE